MNHEQKISDLKTRRDNLRNEYNALVAIGDNLETVAVIGSTLELVNSCLVMYIRTSSND